MRSYEPKSILEQSIEPKAGLHAAHPLTNFGSRSKFRTCNTIFTDSPDETVWQPDVYAEARKLYDSLGHQQVIDIGCGSAEKLARFFGKEPEVFGIDFKGSAAIAKERLGKDRLIEGLLTSRTLLPKLLSRFEDETPRLFICSDVVEHLIDPRSLLFNVRRLLQKNPKNRLVLSTPDRERTWGKDFLDLPPNSAHVREWSLQELVDFLTAFGFTVTRAGNTRGNLEDDVYKSSYVELACSRESYSDFLKKNKFYEKAERLLVSSEHPHLGRSGGIGSYCEELLQTEADHRSLFLYFPGMVDQGMEPDEAFRALQTKDWFAPQSFFPFQKDDSFLAGTGCREYADWVWLAVEQILFLAPHLKEVEYQDYLGLGCRLVQAKEAGLLPLDVALHVMCHGAIPYLEAANREWTSNQNWSLLLREKIAFERSDKQIFATQFLKKFYDENGFVCDEKKVSYRRYPYQLGETKPFIKSAPKIDTLAFLGKRSTMKGFPFFVDVVEQLGRAGQLTDIKNILVLGARDLREDESERKLSHYSKRWNLNLIEKELARKEVLEQLAATSGNAVWFIPYAGDNHPVAVLEVMDRGCLFVAAEAGGIPELVPSDVKSRGVVAPLNVEDFAKAAAALISLSPEQRDSLRTLVQSRFRAEQASLNNSAIAIAPQTVRTEDNSEPSSDDVTVMIPFYNTKIEYLEETIESLHQQSLSCKEILIVNDGSQKANVAQLESLLKSKLRLPYRVLHHEKNRGLAAARNTALRATQTKYLINIDSDDIAMNDFILDLVVLMQRNPSFWAASPYLVGFQDGERWQEWQWNRYSYSGIGPSLALNLRNNFLGHANAIIDVEQVKKVGGWDESDRSMWEDWALYLKIAGHGGGIGIVPKVGCLYRIQSRSMSRTYGKFLAERRLARQIASFQLTKFDSLRILAAYREIEQLTSQWEMIQRTVMHVPVKWMMKTKNRLAQHPRLWKAGKSVNRKLNNLLRR